MPTISVIMTGYNAASTIERAIDSVLSQTFTDWELIVVNDGSVDETAAILERIAAEREDTRLHFFLDEPNVGLPLARNKAMAIATGEWVTFLDADDEFVPDRLQLAVDAMNDQTDMVVCRHVIVGRSATEHVRGTEQASVNGEHMCLGLLTEAHTSYVWDKLYRVSALNGLRFEQVHRAEDKVFNISAARRSRTVQFISDALIRYYVSPTSLTWGRVSTIEETKAVNEALAAACGGLAGRPDFLQALRTSRVLAYLAVAHQMIFNSRDPRELTRHYSWRDTLAAVRLKPVVGAASILLKCCPRAYKLLYKKVWLPAYGL